MERKSDGRKAVFVSYSHQDSIWLDRLLIHLKPLVREHNIDIWSDVEIKAGEKWHLRIDEAIRAAKVAILLISADFLASDFIATNELPPLLKAAEDEGAIILPIILSPSRFIQTKSLAQFQTVNVPSKPLISMSRGEQEETFVRVSEILEANLIQMSEKEDSGVLIRDLDDPKECPLTEPELHTGYLSKIISKERLSKCLSALGCSDDNLTGIANYIIQKLSENLKRQDSFSLLDDIRQHISPLEGVEVAENVADFANEWLSCLSPTRLVGGSFYTSDKKIVQTYRAYRPSIDRHFSHTEKLPDDYPEEKLHILHRYFLETNKIIYSPLNLLLGEPLPTSTDPIIYFIGEFHLKIDDPLLTALPAMRTYLEAGDNRNLYALVSEVFLNPDPFTYQLVIFSGEIWQYPVTMILSRKHIQASSMTASSLADALNGSPLTLSGIGSIQAKADGEYEIHPLICSSSYSTKNWIKKSLGEI